VECTNEGKTRTGVKKKGLPHIKITKGGSLRKSLGCTYETRKRTGWKKEMRVELGNLGGPGPSHDRAFVSLRKGTDKGVSYSEGRFRERGKHEQGK